MKWLAVTLAIFIAPIASADIILFEHRNNSVVTGQVGAQHFSSRFTITAIGDTNDRERVGSAWIIDHVSASIFIDALNSSFDFITATRSFVQASGDLVGFSRASGADLFNGPSHPDFDTWDMTTSIGPLSNNDGFLPTVVQRGRSNDGWGTLLRQSD